VEVANTKAYYSTELLTLRHSSESQLVERHLSDTEICVDWSFLFQTSGKIQLSDYGGSVAVRGLCHSNTRSQQMTGMKNFHKPEWFAIKKKAETRFQSLL